MKAKIIIEAGHTPSRPGAKGYDGVFEHTHTAYLQSRVMLWLDYFQSNIEGLQGSDMDVKEIDRNTTLTQLVGKVNQKPRGSRILSIHFNNNFPKATGSEVFINPKTAPNNKKRAAWMVNHISNIIGIPLRRTVGSRDYKYSHESFIGRLALLDNTIHQAVLIEPCFLNEIDLTKYKGKEDQVAYILALGMMHDFKDNDEPQYGLVKRYKELDRIKATL